MDYTKIQNALNLIKSVCEENKDCNNCPLRNPGCCNSCYIFHRVPEEWEFAEFEGNPCVLKK